MSSNYNIIINTLNKLKIPFDEIKHQVSTCCQDSKKFRDEKGLIGSGSKNILFHCKSKFYLVVTLAENQIKARNFKKEFGSKDIRFATQEEIESIIDSKIGSIPPFGFDNSNLPIYVDNQIFDNEYFIFNPSVPTKSIRILSNDLLKIYDKINNPIKYFLYSGEDFKIL